MTTSPPHPADTSSTLPLTACWELLAAAPIGRVAVLVRHEPLVYPVRHVVEHSTIAFRIHAGDTLLGLTAHPRVTFEVDDIDTTNHQGWSVLVKADVDVAYEAPPDGPRKGHSSTWHVRLHPTEVTGRTVTLPALE